MTTLQFHSWDELIERLLLWAFLWMLLWIVAAYFLHQLHVKFQKDAQQPLVSPRSRPVNVKCCFNCFCLSFPTLVICCCGSGHAAETAGGSRKKSCRSGPQRARAPEQSPNRSLKMKPPPPLRSRAHYVDRKTFCCVCILYGWCFVKLQMLTVKYTSSSEKSQLTNLRNVKKRITTMH